MKKAPCPWPLSTSAGAQPNMWWPWVRSALCPPGRRRCSVRGDRREHQHFRIHCSEFKSLTFTVCCWFCWSLQPFGCNVPNAQSSVRHGQGRLALPPFDQSHLQRQSCRSNHNVRHCGRYDNPAFRSLNVDWNNEYCCFHLQPLWLCCLTWRHWWTWCLLAPSLLTHSWLCAS